MIANPFTIKHEGGNQPGHLGLISENHPGITEEKQAGSFAFVTIVTPTKIEIRIKWFSDQIPRRRSREEEKEKQIMFEGERRE